MRFPLLFALLIQTVSFVAFSQNTDELIPEKKRGSVYLTWGYHRNQYSHSTLHFKDYISDNYHFTLYDAKAKDQPDWDHFFKTPLTVPQYVFRVGYMFNNKRDLGIEFSWDHLKYVVYDGQTLHLKGTIHEVFYDKDTVVTPSFVHFEHTNGNNYAMVSLVKRNTFFTSRNGYHKLSGLFTGGAGILVPKTDSYVLGNHNDGPFRYSGIVIGASAGLRVEFFKYFYLEPSVKAAFADYTNSKVYLHGRVKHHFFSAQYILAAGITVPLGRNQ